MIKTTDLMRLRNSLEGGELYAPAQIVTLPDQSWMFMVFISQQVSHMQQPETYELTIALHRINHRLFAESLGKHFPPALSKNSCRVSSEFLPGRVFLSCYKLPREVLTGARPPDVGAIASVAAMVQVSFLLEQKIVWAFKIAGWLLKKGLLSRQLPAHSSEAKVKGLPDDIWAAVFFSLKTFEINIINSIWEPSTYSPTELC